MKIWTIQPKSVYDEVLKNGIIHCEPKKSEYISTSDEEKAEFGNDTWTFKDSYDWLVKQMSLRVGKAPDGVEYPWWGWHSYGGKNKEPDLRETGLGTREELSYCIELNIPDSEVLISDHGLWHQVLNDCCIWFTKLDKHISDEAFDIAYEEHEKYIGTLTKEKYNKYKIGTWNKIFEDTVWDEKYLQCTFWELRAENIVKATEFKCR